MKQHLEKHNLNILYVIENSNWAIMVGKQPEIEALICRIRKKNGMGVITWEADRLSRNAGDLGKLVDMMDIGKLQHIRTHGQTFSNTPNEKFLLMILCSQAKLENDNRGKNVKRGMKAKCRRGVRPGIPPLGYILFREGHSIRAESQIIIDPDRAPFVKQIFDYVTKDKMSGRKAYKQIVADGFRTRSGKEPTLSMIYTLLQETFYYGEFEYPRKSGNWYKGTHDPIISKRQYNAAQKIIKSNKKSQWGSLGFYFNRFFKCGICGSGVCGEHHTNRHGKTYTYYKCNRYGITRCKQKYIRVEKLQEAVVKLIDKHKGLDENLHKKTQRFVNEHNEMQKEAYGSKAQLMTTMNYIRAILKGKNYRAKKAMLDCLEGQLYLKDGEIYLADSL